jgi:hypothetical protein
VPVPVLATKVRHGAWLVMRTRVQGLPQKGIVISDCCSFAGIVLPLTDHIPIFMGIGQNILLTGARL